MKRWGSRCSRRMPDTADTDLQAEISVQRYMLTVWMLNAGDGD